MTETIKQYLIAILVIVASTTVWVGLIHASNIKLEQRCQAKGGAVIYRPGQPSFCLSPTHK